jgi:hypothetical protein
VKTIEQANEIVVKKSVFRVHFFYKRNSDHRGFPFASVHNRMRDVKDDGIEWMEKEKNLIQGFTKSTGLTKQIKTNAQQSTATSQTSTTDVDSLTRRKFEKFLGSKK